MRCMAKSKRFVASALVVLFVVFLLAPPANAATYLGPKGPHADQRDSDGMVPVYRVCRPGQPWAGRQKSERRFVDGTLRVTSDIKINVCLLEKLGATTKQTRNVIAHEKAHANGWNHWEGSRFASSENYNAAYFPETEIGPGF